MMPIDTITYSDDHHQRRFHPSTSTSQTVVTKPNTSTTTRILVLVLQAVVMCVALLLFFLFAGIAAFVLVHLFIAGRSLRRRVNRRQGPLNPIDDDPCKEGPRPGLSQEELKGVPVSKFSTKSNATKGPGSVMWWPDCAVCLEGFRDGERYRTMPRCGHAFHKGCVDKWLVRSAVCPICRAEVCSSGVDVALDVLLFTARPRQLQDLISLEALETL